MVISDQIDEDTLNRVESIAQAAIEVLKSHGKEGISESERFRTCNKSTCTLYYNAAFIALVDISLVWFCAKVTVCKKVKEKAEHFRWKNFSEKTLLKK